MRTDEKPAFSEVGASGGAAERVQSRFAEIRIKIRKSLTIFFEDFEFGAVRRIAYLVDLEKCFKNEYLVAKSGLDTAENEPSEKCGFGCCYNNLRPTL